MVVILLLVVMEIGPGCPDHGCQVVCFCPGCPDHGCQVVCFSLFFLGFLENDGTKLTFCYFLVDNYDSTIHYAHLHHKFLV